MITSFLAAALAAALPLTMVTNGTEVAPSRQARTLRLSTAQMFRLAELALARSDSATASAVYSVLERNPDADVRAEARYRRSKLLAASGQDREAALLLRRILDEKPEAAPVRLELARLLQTLGDTDAALRELRAAQASGLPPAVARMVDRYSEGLRASRPRGASIEIALAPDTNINHATRSDTLGTIFGDFQIEEGSKAKSGTGLALRAQAFRRFGLGSSDNNVLARASGYADLYSMTKFNDIAADLAIGPELKLGKNRLNIEVGATQRWFGQELFMRSARLGATWTRPLGNRTQLRLVGSASLIDNQMNNLQDGKAYSGQLSLERSLTPTAGAALSFGLDRQSLKDDGYSTTGWRAGVTAWKDIGRATYTASANLGRLNADERLALFPDRRSDRYSRISLGATFRQLTVRGFAPVARFTIERNRSTIEFYDYRRTRSELAVVRAF